MSDAMTNFFVVVLVSPPVVLRMDLEIQLLPRWYLPTSSGSGTALCLFCQWRSHS